MAMSTHHGLLDVPSEHLIPSKGLRRLQNGTKHVDLRDPDKPNGACKPITYSAVYRPAVVTYGTTNEKLPEPEGHRGVDGAPRRSSIPPLQGKRGYTQAHVYIRSQKHAFLSEGVPTSQLLSTSLR